MKVNANNLYGLAMSQDMPNGKFEWVSDDKCCNMQQLLNYAQGRIAIFDTELFNHRENEEDNKSFILKVDLEYSLKLHERDDEYPLNPEVMIIVP